MLISGIAEFRKSLEGLGLNEDMVWCELSPSESRLPAELVERCWVRGLGLPAEVVTFRRYWIAGRKGFWSVFLAENIEQKVKGNRYIQTKDHSATNNKISLGD